MSHPQEPGKSLPPVEYSAKYISWHLKSLAEAVTRQTELLEALVSHFTGKQVPTSQGEHYKKENKFSAPKSSYSNEIPF